MRVDLLNLRPLRGLMHVLRTRSSKDLIAFALSWAYIGIYFLHTLLSPFSTQQDPATDRTGTPFGVFLNRYSWYALNALALVLFFLFYKNIVRFVSKSSLAKAYIIFAILQLPSILLGQVIFLNYHLVLMFLHTILIFYITIKIIKKNSIFIHYSLFNILVSPIFLLIIPLGIIDINYQGILPFRYFGTLFHPNLISSLALFIIVYFWLGTKLSWKRTAPIIAFSLLSLIAAQGKTQWVTLIFITIIIVFMVKFKFSYHPDLRKSLVLLIISALGVLTFIFVSSISKQGTWHFLAEMTGVNTSNLKSMTGRSAIWALSVRAWLENPVFGYGQGLFNQAFQKQWGMYFFSAHNQYLQCLASAGIVGLIGFLVFLWVWLREAWGARKADNYLVLMFFLIFTGWGLTDIPFNWVNLNYAFIMGSLLALLETRLSRSRSHQRSQHLPKTTQNDKFPDSTPFYPTS
jgi:O-antigen ligase